MNRRVLVTGGAGFIGSHVVEQLAAAREHVHVLDDLSRGRAEWVDESVVLHRADIRDALTLAGIVREVSPQAVVHLAAMHFIPAVDEAPGLAREINVEGTATLLRALVTSPPQCLVFASTAAVYPDTSGPIPETCPTSPIDVYGETKVEAERLIQGFEADIGVPCVTARLFNVIGRRETNPHVVPEIVEQLRRGSSRLVLGNLETKRDYTGVTDVAAALVRLLDPSLGGRIFNLGSERATSVRDLVAIFERVVGRRLRVVSDPGRLRPVDRHELVADATAVRKATGWRPSRLLEQTLSELVKAD